MIDWSLCRYRPRWPLSTYPWNLSILSANYNCHKWGYFVHLPYNHNSRIDYISFKLSMEANWTPDLFPKRFNNSVNANEHMWHQKYLILTFNENELINWTTLNERVCSEVMIVCKKKLVEYLTLMGRTVCITVRNIFILEVDWKIRGYGFELARKKSKILVQFLKVVRNQCPTELRLIWDIWHVCRMGNCLVSLIIPLHYQQRPS